MKKILTVLLAAALATGALAGCNSSNQSSSTPGSSAPAAGTESSTDAGAAGKQKVVFWFNHQGDEAKVFEDTVAMYNASQDVYEVEGLSVTDKQKVIVAMASSESPDVVEGSNQDAISYQSSGLIENLSTMAEDGYDLSVFSKQGLAANTFDGSVYALPTTSIVIQMFYNKDILEEIGYNEPPKTMEELYEMAIKATTLDANGNIERLGYPLFPFASARQELNYAFGGRWWAEDGKTLTPNSQGILDALNMNVKYRNEYGIQKVQTFIATANTNRYSEQDMFFTGKQLFRFDGVWLPTMMEQFGSDVNYGVTLIPGTNANPENRGASRFETNSVYIPVVAPNKEGAWDFAKYFANSEGTRFMLLGMGNLPVVTSLWDDPEILAKPGFESFIEALKTENGVQYATISDLAKYTSLIDEHLDYVYNGIQTPEEAMANLEKQAAALQ